MIRRWGYKLREGIGCYLLLLVLPVSVFAPALFQGQVPLSPEGVLALPPWESVEVPPSPDPAPALSTWQLMMNWPAYRFMHDHEGGIDGLLWNPEIGLGQPFLANPTNRSFSPFSVPFYLFEMGFALGLSLCLKLIVSGWIAYYVARRYGFTAGFALIVALLFQWSGPLFAWGGEPLGDVLPWFPLAVLAADRILLGQFWAWPKLSLAVALMLAGGDPRLAIVLVGIVLVYVLLRRVRDSHHVRLRSALPGCAAAIITGFALAAPLLLPTWTLLEQGTTGPGIYPWQTTPETWLALLGADFAQRLLGLDNPLHHLVYLGSLPMLLLGVWAAVRRHVDKPLRHRVESLGLAALLPALLPLLLFDLLPSVPVLRLFHPAHLMAGLAFPAALVVAGVAETWLQMNADECRKVLFKLAFILPVCWGGLLIGVIAAGLGYGAGVPWGEAGGLVATMVVLVVLFGATLLYPRPRVMAGSLVSLLLISICWGRFPEVVHADRAVIFPETRIIQALQATGTRVGGTEGIRAWPLSGNGIPALYARSTASLHRTSRFLAEVDANPLLQRRAGVGSLLLQRSDIQGPYAPVRAELNIVDVFDSGAVLFRDLATTSPYRLVHEVRDLDDPNLPPLTPERVAAAEGFVMARREGLYQDAIRLRDVPTSTSVSLEVETNQPGLLIVASAWYPGWRAWVDGKETPVYPVDGIFQGVEVGAGTQAVDLRFEPRDFRMGCYIFLIALALVIAGVVRAIRAARHGVHPA